MYNSNNNDNNNDMKKSSEDSALLINEDDSSNVQKKKCSRSCKASLICLSCLLLTLTTLFLVINFVVIPNFAESQSKVMTMTLLSGTFGNATNNSIEMTSRMSLNNVGNFDVTLAGNDDVILSDSENVEFGRMSLPSLELKANEENIVDLKAVVRVTSIETFKKAIKELMSNGKNQLFWNLNLNHQKVTAKILGISVHVTLKSSIQKQLKLSRCLISNMVASNVIINNASHSHLSSLADVSFYLSSTFNLQLDKVLFSVYAVDVVTGQMTKQLGTAYMDEYEMKANSYNTMKKLPMIIEKIDSNDKELSDFFSRYTQGIDQVVRMTGPISNIVIDGALEQNITVKGYSGDVPFAFGAAITEQSIQGWSDHKAGVYSTLYNPLGVPLRITSLHGVNYNAAAFSFHYAFAGKHGDCPASNVLGYFKFAKGMWKNDTSKSDALVMPNKKATVFVLSYEPNVKEPQECDLGLGLVKLPFSCCTVFRPIASICNENKQLFDDIDAQLTQTFLQTSALVNTTILINDQFEVNATLKSSFVPVYFDYAVYSGFARDVYMSCKAVTIT